MARPASPSSKRARVTKDAARRPGKKKICQFCADKAAWVDYKDVNLLRRFVSDRGKIKARRVSGNCVQHQREVSIAVKTARELGLIPYAVRAASDRSRGGGRGRGGDESRGPRQVAGEVSGDADLGAAESIDVDEVENDESEALT
jgi:small subunit ribosomal protein S18